MACTIRLHSGKAAWNSLNRWDRRSSRRGSLTLEAVLVLPILLLATLAVFQFGVLMLIEQTITHAVTVAAREAGKGADIDATALSVNAVLGLHGLSVGPGATLILEDSLSTPAVQVRGTFPCPVPSTPSVPPGMLKATLCVDLTQKPFFNLLATCGLDFTGRKFTVSAMAHREFDGPPEITPRPECSCR